MHREARRLTCSLALILALALAGALVSLGSATTLPGKGPAASECYVTLEVEGTKAASAVNKLECQDGDPTCDQDGDCHNNSCTFQIQACPNQPGISGCTPSSLKKLVAKVKGKPLPAPSLTGSACGALLRVDVKLKGKKHKPGKAKCVLVAKATSGKPKVDKDKDTLTCMPSSVPAGQPCPAVTTTSTSTSSTTSTTLPTCGDGAVTGNEQCDPPCSQGQCATGQICNSQCQCETAAACACGATDPDRLQFMTVIGSGNCGEVKDGGGNHLIDLACAGLYFGGGADAVPLPATVPDMGGSLTKACCNGSSLTLAAAAAGEVGATMLTCTKKDCLFGPPLPIPNRLQGAAPLSTCVINVVARDAVGSADCSTGASTIDLPLTSEIYLTGDLDNDPTTGLQPCPICGQTCSGGDRNGLFCNAVADCPGGGTCTGSNTCHFGPNDGMACTPGDSAALGDAYPSSHDCPPASNTFIGSLPIPFLLTTGTSMKPAQNFGGENGQARAFCGFCRDVDGTFCFEGQPESDGCPPSAGLHTCTSNADCAQPFEGCSQRSNGAFQQGAAALLTETGSPAGDLTDHQPHASTLVSVFCIPPTFNGAVDGAADLPGPGAVALPGMAQVLP